MRKRSTSRLLTGGLIVEHTSLITELEETEKNVISLLQKCRNAAATIMSIIPLAL